MTESWAACESIGEGMFELIEPVGELVSMASLTYFSGSEGTLGIEEVSERERVSELKLLLLLGGTQAVSSTTGERK